MVCSSSNFRGKVSPLIKFRINSCRRRVFRIPNSNMGKQTKKLHLGFYFLIHSRSYLYISCLYSIYLGRKISDYLDTFPTIWTWLSFTHSFTNWVNLLVTVGGNHLKEKNTFYKYLIIITIFITNVVLLENEHFSTSKEFKVEYKSKPFQSKF